MPGQTVASFLERLSSPQAWIPAFAGVTFNKLKRLMKSRATKSGYGKGRRGNFRNFRNFCFGIFSVKSPDKRVTASRFPADHVAETLRRTSD
jgi:hypothetical protein